MKTLKNKICATIMILVGIAPVIWENDATVLLFFGSFAVPLFFAKDNWIY